MLPADERLYPTQLAVWHVDDRLEMKDELVLGDGALKLYSQLATWAFNYLDVQQRIRKLREERGKK